MATSTIKVIINKPMVAAKIEAAFKAGLPVMTEEVKNDCNQYCKWDTGALAVSADIHSIPKDGLVIWQTPYARRQYWIIQTAHKDKNPNATWKWCEAAKAACSDKWGRQAQKLLEMNL